MIEDGDPFADAYTKIHDAYTSPEKATPFGSPINLARARNCLLKHVNRYLNSSETYTKFKLTRKCFSRLNVISCRLNEVWSCDLAAMQQISRENLGVRYLFVAVDASSCFLWVVGVKSETSKACSEALKKLISTNKQRNAPNICATKKFLEKKRAHQVEEFAGEFAKFCKENGLEIYCTRSETKSAVAERYIRTLETIIFKYLHERDTNPYTDQLEKIVSIIANRISRMTKLAPIEVSQKTFLT